MEKFATSDESCNISSKFDPDSGLVLPSVDVKSDF